MDKIYRYARMGEKMLSSLPLHCKLINCFAECLWSVKTDKLFQKVLGICKVKGTIRWFTCCFASCLLQAQKMWWIDLFVVVSRTLISRESVTGMKPYLKEVFGKTLFSTANLPTPSVSCFSLLTNVTLSIVSKALPP